tara:strand:- start:658 stop:3507 length:2850 start_codon:yes stop_codon:yes gene_type:complete
MPKAFYNMNDFSGGLNSALDPRDIGENEMSDVENIMLEDRKSIRPMGGDTEHSDVSSGTAGHICPGYGAFVFESDHERGPRALDTGENWLGIVDSKNGEVDLYDLGSDSFQSGIFDMGTASTSGVFSTNELAFAGNADGYDTITADSLDAVNFITQGFRKGDIIGIAGCTSVTDNNFNGLRVRTVSALVLTLDHSGVLTDRANEAGTVTITRLTQGVFYFADEALRVSDASFGSSIQNKWYGYIKRRPFQDISGSMEHLVDGGDFSSNWTGGNGWTLDSSDASYAHHASPATLVQTVADMTIGETIPNAIYKFTYTMSGLNLGTSATLQASITTAHAATSTDLTMSDATTSIYYKTKSGSAGAFTIGITGSSTNAAFNLDDVSLTFYGFDDWHDDNNTLAPPSDITVRAGYANAGDGFRLSVATPVSDSGTWAKETYQIAGSYIYDGNQESFLHIPETNHTFDVDTALDALDIDVRATLTDAESTGSFNPRISGARIYTRISTSSDPWSLLLDISLRDGVRGGLSGVYAPWVVVSGVTIKVDETIVRSPALETYEILNSFPANKDANEQLTISGTGEGYKTAIVANRRAFVANVKTVNEDSETVQMRDRIMYTPIGKFDTFPRSYFIDVVKGDAEEFTKLEEFSDRLLAFKNRKLYIINIASPSPSNWYVEDIKDFVGIEHPYASTKTDFGVCWVNKFGVFLYDGQNVTNLLFNRIKESTWQTYFKRDTLIGYNPRRYYLIVLKNAFADVGDVYIYDFRTQSWIKGQSAFDDNYNRANMVVDWNSNTTSVYQTLLTGDLYWTSETTWEGQISNTWSSTSDAYEIKEWTDSMRNVGEDKFVVTTKDIDFGEPGRTKKIYGVTLTYKSDNDQTQPIFYDTDGGTSFSSQLTGDFSGTGTGWKQVRAQPSSPISCQSIRFKIVNATSDTGSSEGVQINDVAVEYRPIYQRVS